jgi:hypothetical protein
MRHVRLTLCTLPLLAAPALAQSGGPYSLAWNTIDGGGGTSTGGIYTLSGTIGQHDAGKHTAGAFTLTGGFWAGIGSTLACYPNCDGSSVAPILNVDDFTCFINKFALNDAYANCDGSTVAPILNVDDFTCFINQFALGCP